MKLKTFIAYMAINLVLISGCTSSPDSDLNSEVSGHDITIERRATLHSSTTKAQCLP